MKTGFQGTFVISWTQSELDGQKSPPVTDLEPGRVWAWTGEAVRVDGPSGILPLGDPVGEADLRKRAALTVRRLLLSMQADQQEAKPLALQEPLFDKQFVVTNGITTWTVSVIPGGAGRKPLLMFHGEIPPRSTELWVVRHNIDGALQTQASKDPGGVICFTPGTMIQTADGPRDVAGLREGDWVQTKDNGLAEILWLGRRHVSGARLMALPALTPVRLRAGSLDKEVPDTGLLVSPDHRMVLKGARAMDVLGNKEARIWVSAVKAMVPERVCEIIDQAMQVHGAAGISQWFPLAEMYTGQRTLRLADGPDEVHHHVVARAEVQSFQNSNDRGASRSSMMGKKFEGP